MLRESLRGPRKFGCIDVKYRDGRGCDGAVRPVSDRPVELVAHGWHTAPRIFGHVNAGAPPPRRLRARDGRRCSATAVLLNQQRIRRPSLPRFDSPVHPNDKWFLTVPRRPARLGPEAPKRAGCQAFSWWDRVAADAVGGHHVGSPGCEIRVANRYTTEMTSRPNRHLTYLHGKFLLRATTT